MKNAIYYALVKQIVYTSKCF